MGNTNEASMQLHWYTKFTIFGILLITGIAIVVYGFSKKQTPKEEFKEEFKTVRYRLKPSVSIRNDLIEQYESYKLNGIISFSRDWQDIFVSKKLKRIGYEEISDNEFLKIVDRIGLVGISYENDDIAVQNMLFILLSYNLPKNNYLVSNRIKKRCLNFHFCSDKVIVRSSTNFLWETAITTKWAHRDIGISIVNKEIHINQIDDLGNAKLKSEFRQVLLNYVIDFLDRIDFSDY